MKRPAIIAFASAFSLSLISLTAMAQGTTGAQPPSGDQSFLQIDQDLDGKITQQEASQSQLLKDKFAEADLNQDGSVDASEFSAFIAQSDGAGQQQQQASATQSFSSLDKNQDGKLDQSEAQAHPTLSQQYSSADKDQDGSISQSEFSAFEAQQGQQASGGQQAAGGIAPFEQIDSNKDGWISRKEYQSHTGGGGQATGQVSFQSLDTNGDGGISQDEANSAPMLSQQFAQYDQDQNGYVDQSEFSAFEQQQQQQGQ